MLTSSAKCIGKKLFTRCTCLAYAVFIASMTCHMRQVYYIYRYCTIFVLKLSGESAVKYFTFCTIANPLKSDSSVAACTQLDILSILRIWKYKFAVECMYVCLNATLCVPKPNCPSHQPHCLPRTGTGEVPTPLSFFANEKNGHVTLRI